MSGLLSKYPPTRKSQLFMLEKCRAYNAASIQVNKVHALIKQWFMGDPFRYCVRTRTLALFRYLCQFIKLKHLLDCIIIKRT